MTAACAAIGHDHLADELATERAHVALVRQLHDAVELCPSLIVCEECSRPGQPVVWPCMTTKLLDGLYD